MSLTGALTKREFLDRYGIGHTTFYEEVKSGRLKITKVGAKTLVKVADAEAWLAALPTATGPLGAGKKRATGPAMAAA